MMKHTLTADDANIDYTLLRKKMKNIRIRVTGAGVVVVSAPHHTPQNRIHRLVYDNRATIVSQLERITAQRRHYYPERYQDGDTFWFLGREIPLRVMHAKKPDARLVHRTLHLSVPSHFGYDERKKFFILWLKKRAKSIFTERAEILMPSFPDLAGLDIRISVKNMLTRWGSANTKRHTINLSVHLLRCGIELVDYVITHELCHFTYANHSRAYYQTLEAHCPSRRQLDRRLKEYGLIDF